MTSAAAIPLLVPTKLAPPRLHAGLIRRERLFAQLGATPTTRLTLLVAPAGFGKSTLAAQWLAGGRQKADGRGGATTLPTAVMPPFAWLTLDEHDREVIPFLAYVAGAIERVAPGTLQHTTPLLRAAESPAPAIILQALLVDLSARSEPLVLVLDEYHLVTAEAIHHTVVYLLRNLPGQCRLVLLSRSDPPLPLVRLRAEQQVTELRAADLRFTNGETVELLTALHGAAPEPAYVAELYRQTEGWALALQLAALVQEDGVAHGAVSAHHQITEYLADEVFTRQPAALQAALPAFAVPERFCVGLGAALLDQADELRIEDTIEQMMRANLLLTPLEGEGGWYRFHPMFRDLLLRRLRLTFTTVQVQTFQVRAAQWLAQAGLYAEAIRLYLEAGALDAAGALVEGILHRELGRDLSSVAPMYWLRQLPADLIARRPGLMLIKARIEAIQMDVAGALASVERAGALMAAQEAAGLPLPWPTFYGDLAVLRGTAMQYGRHDPAAVIDELWQGVRLGAVPSLAATGLAFLARAYAAAGRYSEGVRFIEGLSDGAGEVPIRITAPMRHTALSMMHELVGRMDDFTRESQALAQALAAHTAQGTWVAVVPVFRGRAAYECSDLHAAATHFTEVRAAKYQTNAYSYIGCLIGLTQIALAQDALADAELYAQEVWAFANEMGSALLRNEALGCAVRVALVRGDTASALTAAEQITPDAHLGSRGWYAIMPPQLSQAAALLAAGDTPSLTRAEALITTIMAVVEPVHNIRPLVAAQVMQALVHEAQGRRAEALRLLERVIDRAAPLGLLRTIIDCGPALHPLLLKLDGRGAHAGYVRRLLHFYAAPQPSAAHSAPAPVALALPELLTRREQEILDLLDARWSDKEIAEQLVIAPNTVRKHTSTIYSKLGVSSRREAVEVARSLGLLR
jgi:LuxR family maltose regulon positive regulatory protein